MNMEKNKNKKNKNNEKIEVVVNDSSKTYSQDEINQYQKTGFWAKIPYAVKALVLKYWFFGAIVFFVMMRIPGLQSIDYALICGIVGGAIIDVACNNLLLLMEGENKEAQHFMMYKSKRWAGVLSLLVTIVYEILLFGATSYFCSWIVSMYKDPVNNWFLQEPFTIALVLLVFDAIIMTIKFGLKKLFIKKKD